MKRFVFKKEIYPSYLNDVKELQAFIENTMHIQISLRDAYDLWDSISDSWCASWLVITTHPEDETREEFLLREMSKRGYFEEV